MTCGRTYDEYEFEFVEEDPFYSITVFFVYVLGRSGKLAKTRNVAVLADNTLKYSHFL